MDHAEQRAQEKRAAVEMMLAGGVTMVHLDARAPGVRVPVDLAASSWLRLNLGHIKGRGCTASEWGVRESLSFRGEWYDVAIPWAAIFGVSRPGGEDLHLDPESMPADVRARLEAPAQRTEVEAPAKVQQAPAAASKPRGHLRLVQANDRDAE